MVIKATNLELVSSLSTVAFVATLKRFTERLGHPFEPADGKATRHSVILIKKVAIESRREQDSSKPKLEDVVVTKNPDHVQQLYLLNKFFTVCNNFK